MVVSRRALFTGSVRSPAIGDAGVESGSEPGHWDGEYDVAVVGSGAAGCAAALFAAVAGAKVVILEKSDSVGGLTARSDGRFWIPNNPRLQSRGLSDPKEDFLRYVAHCAFPGRYKADAENLGVDPGDLALMAAFYDHGAAMVSELEALGGFKSAIAPAAYDYPAHVADNKCRWGRSLTLDTRGRDADGATLIARFGQALKARGVTTLTGHAVQDVVRDGGRVVGVVAQAGGKTKRIGARKGVVFATGGYLLDPKKRAALHMEPLHAGYAIPGATGDFIPIAAACGAMQGNLKSAWRIQGVLKRVPDYGARVGDFALPGDSAILVDARGERRLNEAASSHDRARTMYRWDANRARYPDLVNIYVYDDRAARLYAGLYPFAQAGKTTAEWVLAGDTLEDLTSKLRSELDALGQQTGHVTLGPDFATRLSTTVDRFNAMAVAGRDDDFDRGVTDVERQTQVALLKGLRKGAANPYPNPCLHPLAKTGPYYAIILIASAVDTNGGPVINPSGQVLDNRRQPIPGLYAAGNCVASPAHDAPWGPGAPAGLAMTFGMLAGRAVAAEAAHATSARQETSR
jgi:succinate dehydrogenase/fumarate reductase flavoprotein subunit